MRIRNLLRYSLTALIISPFLICPALAGDMTPDAPPASTMKNLQTVEPRTPITELPCTISNPGSYYLSASLSTAGSGITISASDVTIDLNGFTLQGGSGDGITASGLFYNIVVQNGIVRGWSQDGVDLSGTRNSRIQNISLYANQGDGVRSSWGALISHCVADGNHGRGIAASDGSKVDNCVARYNGGDGITIGNSSTIMGCTVTQNGGRGIYGSGGALIKNCVINQNTGDGIAVATACKVIENECYGNGFNGDGAGINAASFNRIVDNTIIGNDRGIELTSNDNVIDGNMVKGNTDNYSITGDNQLSILLCEVPETIDWPARVVFAGTLKCDDTSVPAITVNASDVTIDLAGHSLVGIGSQVNTHRGITITTGNNIVIMNGTIKKFCWGIAESNDNEGGGQIFKNLIIDSNWLEGIYLGSRDINIVLNCVFKNNSDRALNSDNSLIDGCVFYNNATDIFYCPNCTYGTNHFN